MTNYCRDCDNVHPTTRKEPPWKWVCMKARASRGYGLVHPDYSPEPPYERCSRVRNQQVEMDCPMFEPARVKEKVDG